MVTDYRILYRNKEAFFSYNVLKKRFIKIYVSKYKKGVFGQKKTNDSYVENSIFQKIGESSEYSLHAKYFTCKK